MLRFISIIPNRKIYLTISGVLIAASIAALAIFGLKFGIDFTGGSLLEVTFTDEVPESAAIGEVLEPLVGQNSVQIADDGAAIMRFRDVVESDHQAVMIKLTETFGEIEEQRFESIGPTIGADLQRSGLMAVGAGLLAIMLFVAYAFRGVSRPVASWQYGIITAVVALMHDVLIPLGIFAVLGKFYGVEVNTPFIAALLTVLGYSVNDTIVIFDRVRENLRRYAGEPFGEIVERSLHETFGRSLNTSLTLLFAVGAIWWFGSAAVRPFALTLFLGVAIGTYSSLFLASTSLVTLERWLSARRNR